MLTIPVIIVGAGPVGLSASMALSRQGIRNLVIEKHSATSIHPKARGVNVRTMELCRVWGIEQQIRQSELPATARRFLWMKHLKGKIEGEVAFDIDQGEISPTEPCLLSQDLFEQELLDSLKAQKNSQIQFSTRVVNIEQDDSFVYCETENLVNNTQDKIQCEYLIAADGANSFVREKIGVSMEGIPLLGTHVSVYFEADLSPWLADKPFAVLAFADKKQMGHVMMAVDLKQRWIVANDPNIYENTALVGMRAPHCWLSYKNSLISTVDLFETNYVLLAGENCDIESLNLPIPQQWPLTTLVIGKDIFTLDQDFYAIYQLKKEQAILVRPDGHVAWRS